jgi:hypothetical protein
MRIFVYHHQVQNIQKMLNLKIQNFSEFRHLCDSQIIQVLAKMAVYIAKNYQCPTGQVARASVVLRRIKHPHLEHLLLRAI